jgi:hypothetical protein
MYRKWFLLSGVIDLFILSLLDRIAFHYFLYWRFAWFDIMMHLIGGVAIGLVSAYAYWEWQKDSNCTDSDKKELIIVNKKSFILLNLCFVLITSFSWEIFEVWVDRIVRFNLVNILQDLFFGVAGSLIIGLLILWIHNHKLKKLK